ncbi:MAG: succinate dehydrogenase flavoprotein subunit [Candidatus Caenarcaniphilales bacterium]|nr:succinate dehydrogenase flavoprotein subunit [Candidatus Caenarcaniphilales bacterium]
MNDSSKTKVAIIGGGLAGLAAAMKIAEMSAEKKNVVVQLFSIVPVKRSHSVCAQGGINAANKTTGDSTYQHFDDTVYGGDFLANQWPVQQMCEAAPDIIDLFDRMGVPFNRTPEGNIDRRRFGGTLHPRTAYAGATTGQQLLYALDEQVRRYEEEGLVEKYEGWEYLSTVFDEDRVACGIVAQNLVTMEVKSFPVDAVILATGGPGLVYGRSTNSVSNNGLAVVSLYQQGAKYANPEFIQVHPTAIGGDDKLRLMSESARGEGGRVWVWGDSSKTWIDNDGNSRPCGETGKPWYFLEEKYPAYGNLVPRDIATREIFKVVYELKLGIEGRPFVNLDVSHIAREKGKEFLDRKLKGILEIYEKFKGVDPHKVPMEIFPAVHYSMGGLWVDDRTQMTNLTGVFAAGECDYQYHGANRLGANSLLSCVFTGLMIAGPEALKFATNRSIPASQVSSNIFEAEVKKQNDFLNKLLNLSGPESPRKLHKELGDIMTENVTIVRDNKALKKTDEKIKELKERFWNITVPDKATWANQSIRYAHQLYHLLNLARAITLGALNRNESRGAHYKPEFPERDDDNWLKTTICTYDPSTESPIITYENVDTTLITPRKRDYTKKSVAASKS